jgi:TatD DNase family protein
MIKYIDIHSHLNFEDFDSDREEVISRMEDAGVATITIGTSVETSKSGVILAKSYENIFAAVGIHPGDEKEAEYEEDIFEELAKDPKVVSVGECGLDYGRSGLMDEEEKKRQKKLFERQIDFAVKWNKPLMLHARNSNRDILDILEVKKKEYGERLQGNAHFFTGSVEEAARFLHIDFSISLTGVITFARDYDEAIRYVPIKAIMAETDAPYVAPIPWRGKRNEPVYVIEVVRKIAEIKGLDFEKTAEILRGNAVAKFNLPC